MKLQQSFDTLYNLDFYEYSEMLRMVKEESKSQKQTNEEIQVDVKPKSGFIPLSDLNVE